MIQAKSEQSQKRTILHFRSQVYTFCVLIYLFVSAKKQMHEKIQAVLVQPESKEDDILLTKLHPNAHFEHEVCIQRQIQSFLFRVKKGISITDIEKSEFSNKIQNLFNS